MKITSQRFAFNVFILTILPAGLTINCSSVMKAKSTAAQRPSSEARPVSPPATGDSAGKDMKEMSEDDESDSRKKIADISEKSVKSKEAIKPAESISTAETFQTRPPELLSRYDGNDLKPLPLKAQDISVVIKGHRSRVVFDLVYENPSDSQLAGEFMIALPDGCSPVYLGMFQGSGIDKAKVHAQTVWLNHAAESFETLTETDMKLTGKWQSQTGVVDWGELRSAKVVNPVKGREVYENVTRQRIDPALAEWSGTSKFTTRVFPIQAKGYKRIIFAYEGPVGMSKGNYQYVLPWPVKTTNEKRMTVHVLNENLKSAKIVSDGEGAPNAQSTKYGTKYIFKNSSLKEDSFFTYQAEPKNAMVQTLAADDKDLKARLAHIRIMPVSKPQKVVNQTGKAVIIIDVSYSAKDKLHNLSGKMLRNLLVEDKSITEFAVVAFDVSARKISGFADNEPDNRKAIFEKIEKIHLEGATNFHNALQLILADKELSSADAYFLLSDGQITWGEEKPLTLENKFSEIFKKKWITYRFGDNAINQSLFDSLSKYAGRTVHVNHGDNLKVAAVAHLQSGIPLGKIEISPDADFMTAGNPRFVYPGQYIELAVKAPARTEKLDIRLQLNGKEKRIPVTLEPESQGSAIAARAWAQLYANRLLDFYDAEADTLALALSQKFYLTNRAASFIILETDQEYKTHKIESEKYSLSDIVKKIETQKKQPGYGIEGTEKIKPEPLALLRSLRRLQQAQVYNTLPAKKTAYDIFKTTKRDKDDPIAIYKQALSLYEQAPGLALRVLSSIVELKPQDDKALRMTGFVLLQWGLYQPAAELFARSRQRRPFEPQNYMLEAIALTSQNKVYEAALLFETVLHNTYQRSDEYAKITAAALYKDMLEALANSGNAQFKKEAEQRIAQLRSMLESMQIQKKPSGRLVLFWNIDNTDVDLYVSEGKEEVSYNNKSSSTGGRLYWDNTAGLGPELYDHPLLSKEGFNVTVNYFGSAAVEGQAPSTTMAIAILYNKPKPALRFYTTTLIDQKSGKIPIMPLFKE